MEIVLSPRQYHELRVEIARDIAAIGEQKSMDPGQVIGQGLDVAHIKGHLEALTRILGKETVDRVLAAGGAIHVRVDDWTRKD